MAEVKYKLPKAMGTCADKLYELRNKRYDLNGLDGELIFRCSLGSEMRWTHENN